MALIQCKECSKEVSELAATCPHCGAPVFSEARQNAAIRIISSTLLIMFLTVVFYMIFIANPFEPKPTKPTVKPREFELRVVGTPGTQFTGRYEVLLDGTTITNSLSGTVPASFSFQGIRFICTLVKAEDNGKTLEVEIWQKYKKIDSMITAAPHGKVSVTF